MRARSARRHIPRCLQDFYQKECWAHHPKPHQEYIDLRRKQVGLGGWVLVGAGQRCEAVQGWPEATLSCAPCSAAVPCRTRRWRRSAPSSSPACDAWVGAPASWHAGRIGRGGRLWQLSGQRRSSSGQRRALHGALPSTCHCEMELSACVSQPAWGCMHQMHSNAPRTKGQGQRQWRRLTLRAERARAGARGGGPAGGLA